MLAARLVGIAVEEGHCLPLAVRESFGKGSCRAGVSVERKGRLVAIRQKASVVRTPLPMKPA